MIILLKESTETYQKDTISLERLKTATTVEHCGFRSRGLHFAVEKEKSVYSFRRFLKN
jgi:hypothetical protein